MIPGKGIRPRLLALALLAGMAAPALARAPILKCVLMDENTVRCRSGHTGGRRASDANVEVVDYAGRTLLSRKLGKEAAVTFPRPRTGYYVQLDVGPGNQTIVEHDEIRPPEPGDRAQWIRR